ncbi:hypothetical protein ABZP36_035718 [Zizania latifolia]
MKRDSSLASKVKRIAVLGGACFAAGNATPSAEANIENVAQEKSELWVLDYKDLLELRNSEGKHAQFVCGICKLYREWHVHSYGTHALFLHAPVSFLALVHLEYLTFKECVVRVPDQGILP